MWHFADPGLNYAETLISVTDALELYYSHGLLATSFVSGLWLEWGLP